MIMDNEIFREYDIRGIFESQFDLDFAFQLGQAYVRFLEKRSLIRPGYITLGYDARVSSPKIADQLARGITSSGVECKILGLVTSPMSYFTTFFYPEVLGSIMVTGSHNPPEYNGFKISVGKGTIFGADIKELEQIISSKDFPAGSSAPVSSMDIKSDYVNRYKEEFGKLPDPGVVLDCGNGSGGAIARALYQGVGIEPIMLFEEPDGTFPNHHPDPTVAKNLTSLIDKVKSSGSKIGIGFDGDADRIGVVDESGRILVGDEFIALMSQFILEDHPMAKIVGDVKCSDEMYSFIAKKGGNPIMWKTGHSLIKEKIKDEKSPFGGELSGHIFFNDRNYGYDDALYAGLRIIEILGKTGKTIRELLEGFAATHSTPEIRIDTTEDKKSEYVDKVVNYYSNNKDVEVNLIDGVRVSFDHGWALARVSNTQPVIVFRFESKSEELLAGMIEQFEKITGLDLKKAIAKLT